MLQIFDNLFHYKNILTVQWIERLKLCMVTMATLPPAKELKIQVVSWQNEIRTLDVLKSDMARKTFKVLSFFEWMLTVRTNTMYTVYIVVTIVTISILWCPEVHEGLPVCLTDQDQQQGLVFDFPKTLVFFLLQQDRLVFFSSFTHTVLSESCWSSGKVKSGFPATFRDQK